MLFPTIRRLQALLLPVILWLAANLAVSSAVYGKELVSTEYQLKSVLLYKLTRFVDWPQNETSATGSFKICVLGRDDFGSALDALEKYKVKGVLIKVLRFTLSEQVDTSCRMLVISASKQPFIKTITNQFKPYPILTVGDTPHFANLGGMIQFVLKNKKIGFTINLQKATDCKLKIAAPLLQMSTIVKAKQ